MRETTSTRPTCVSSELVSTCTSWRVASLQPLADPRHGFLNMISDIGVKPSVRESIQVCSHESVR